MIRRLRIWWLRRRLHEECVMNHLMMEQGFMAPFGLCIACEPRFTKLRSLLGRFPEARALS